MANPEEHFETLEQQITSAKLGMWVFLASEVLLFSALFALYVGYRLLWPAAFYTGVHENAKLLGSLNTVVLICSSLSVAMAVHALRGDRRKLATALVGLTVALACVFLVVKGIEYRGHFHHGIWPGGKGAYFAAHPDRGLAIFFTLYYLMTGAHALHVIIGGGVLVVLGWMTARGRLHGARNHPLEVGALYWHLVDIVWIFLWPLFYLAGGRG